MENAMDELPLFPLGSVLFPGMVINLHIFEERYKQMINLCLETRQPFGVVLIKEGQEAYGPATPYMVGCTARIARMQPLGQGRMEIAAIGQERFEVQSLVEDRPYLVGHVRLWPMAHSDPALVEEAVATLRPFVVRYLDILSQVGNVQINTGNLPADPVEFTYMAASILQQTPPVQKQRVLSAANAPDLIQQVATLYKLEVTLLEEMVERSENNDTSSDSLFSMN